MRLCLPLLLLGGVVAVADEPKPGAEDKGLPAEAKKELKKLEGKWRVVKVANGNQEADVKDREVYFVFKGAEVTLTASDKEKTETLRVTAIDPATDPVCIDLLEKRAGRPDRTLEGVYKIDGDTLRLAFSVPREGKNRPTSFEKPGDRATVWTFKRVKE
jgi:uncharacterized protein (TIGR03067 family)